MKPEGRKSLIHNAGKHKIKAQKQNPAWWENMIIPSKRKVRRSIKSLCNKFKRKNYEQI